MLNRVVRFILILLVAVNCNRQSTTEISYEEEGLHSIYQHDYYPDSIFLTRSIKWNLVHESAYSYCLQFSKDSCQFIGYHESWWQKIKKIRENKFITDGLMFNDYFEIEFTSAHQLRIRNIEVKGTDSVKHEYKPYHSVGTILTQAKLQKRMAKELFAGTYQVIFKDTLACDSIIILDENFGLSGVDHFSTYGIETEIDWDFGLDNACWLGIKGKKLLVYFSFKFSGDTLTLSNYKLRTTDSGEVPEITGPLLTMVKRN